MADTCNRLRPLIQAHLDGELDREGLRRLEAHVGGCPACAAALSAGRLAISAMAALPSPEPSPDFCAAVERGIAGARLRRARWQLRLAGVGVAGTCLIAAAFVLIWRAVSPAVWAEVVGWGTAAVRVMVPLADALGDAALTLGRALVPVGGIAAKLSWLGIAWLGMWYGLALGALLLVIAVTRGMRRPGHVPALAF